MIILVGLMGSGKSILGKQLASRLSLVFVDLDEKIVEQEGKSIPQIFTDDGEGAFRSIECNCLASVLDSKGSQIIATGGGAILSAKNRAFMEEKGTVIWLDANVEVLAARISGDKNRPLLNDVNPLEKMMELTAQRNALYAEVADLRIDTGLLSDKEAVAKIVAFLSE